MGITTPYTNKPHYYKMLLRARDWPDYLERCKQQKEDTNFIIEMSGISVGQILWK
jgi:hypothetical protein